MPNDFGYYNSLAVRTNLSDQIGDYERHDLRQKQNRQLAESKAALFANDLQYQNAANSFDHQRIKSFADNKIKEIGKFYKENPDALYNPDKLVILNGMKKELQDNSETIRGFASDNNFKALNADLQEVAKNPQMHNQLAYQKLLEQKENYLKYGNQLGLEASQKEGFKPFVYQKPAEFIDLSKKGSELGNNFKDLKPVTLKNGRSGAWQTVANEATLNRDAQAFYLEHKEQFDQQHGKDGLKVAKELIRSGINQKFDWGNTNLADDLYKMKLQTQNDIDKIKARGKGGEGFDYFKKTIQEKKVGADAPERLDATFGSKPKHTIMNDDGSISFDNTGDVFNYNGDFQEVGNGIKRLSGYVYKPLKWAKDKGVLVDPEGWSDNKELAGTDFSDYKIDGSWSQKASIVDSSPDKEGKTRKLIKLKVFTDIDSNSPAYQGKYNSLVATTDQRNSVTPTANTPKTIVQDGYTYTWNPATNTYE